MISPFLSTTTRNVPVQAGRAAVFFIDVQNYCLHPDGAEMAEFSELEQASHHRPFIERFVAQILPNMQALQRGAPSRD